MKRLTVILLAISLAIVACNISLPSGVQGSGNIVTQSIDVGGFDQVGLTTIGNVYIEQGDTESLTIETDDNILP
jgi:predicted small secreted protein